MGILQDVRLMIRATSRGAVMIGVRWGNGESVLSVATPKSFIRRKWVGEQPLLCLVSRCRDAGNVCVTHPKSERESAYSQIVKSRERVGIGQGSEIGQVLPAPALYK